MTKRLCAIGVLLLVVATGEYAYAQLQANAPAQSKSSHQRR